MDLKLGDTRLIINACKARGVLRNQCALVLATAYHETAHTMKPIYERGSKAYFSKYETGTKIGKALGNAVKGDGYLFRGRGYVQLTGRTNYARAGQELGIDLLRQPDLALLSANAAPILVIGMIEGWFTGKKLSTYITAGKSDFTNARRIINGTDKASLIAGYAQQYDDMLLKAGYGAPAKPLALLQPVDPVPVVPDPPTKETIQAVQNRLKELGYNPGGADGKMGPLTRGAILSFKNDAEGLTPNDTIDEAFLTALATASPRKMAPDRANATQAQVAAVAPEVRTNVWTKIGAFFTGVMALIGSFFDGILGNLGAASGYIQPVKDAAGDVPGWVWMLAIAGVAGGLFLVARHGAAKGVEAFQSGERR
ncbi:peptidoglycan-binding protein [Mesorhizobium amorphae]|uniref:peptidoglycan-binding protein n=1 Tax=Mesorhizobium amorphae TaxID=71433 RepID=UPI00177F7F9A|nr:peptidoglycan-binding protein [Mesorhizobium amorphae]